MDDQESPKSEQKRGFFSSWRHPAEIARSGEDAPLLAGRRTAEDAYDEEGERPQSAWQRNAKIVTTKTKRWAVLNPVSLIIGACLVIALLVAIVFNAYQQPNRDRRPVPNQPAEICLTSECVVAASGILQNLSPRRSTIDPCEDFSTYVCEGFDLTNDLAADESSTGAFNKIGSRSQTLLRHLLESPYSEVSGKFTATSSTDEENFAKLQTAYDACMDTEAIEALGSKPLLKLLSKIDELYPAKRPDTSADNFNAVNENQKIVTSIEESHELARTLDYLMGIDVHAFFNFAVGNDEKEVTKNVVHVQPLYSHGLPAKEWYHDAMISAQYANTIGEVLSQLLKEVSSIRHQIRGAKNGKSPSSCQYHAVSEELVRSIVTFETQLADATPAPEDLQDIELTYNEFSIDDLQTLFPQASFRYLFDAVFPGYLPDSKIVVSNPWYFSNVSSILKDTSKETIQAFLTWKTVQKHGSLILSNATKPLRQFNNKIQGLAPDTMQERYKTCIRHVEFGLSWLLSKFFVDNAFSEAAKEFGDELVTGIRHQFIERLDKTEWMTRSNRDLAIEKLHKLNQGIGYPTVSPDIRNATQLNEWYSNVNVSKDAYFANSIAMIKDETARDRNEAGKPVNFNHWYMPASLVNAYYDGFSLVFPAGIMQPPIFYTPSVPSYLNYGAFGHVIGHEITHAFDSNGRHYDQNGTYRDWWDPSTISAFEDRASCFVEQYSNFTIPGLKDDDPCIHVNGKLTLGENLADGGGILAAFGAWKEYERKQVARGSPSQLLPGLLEYTKEQLFFLSMGGIWCEKMRRETLVSLVLTNEHAPGTIRLMGTVANSRDFKEAFDCPVKEPTCEMW
ncbi:hypothetical protein MMC25_004340 [Agyrium rufum]|nr:hypothetical protein [Agyrium rufum]